MLGLAYVGGNGGGRNGGRQDLQTPLGKITETTETFSLAIELSHKLQKLAEQPYAADNEAAVKIKDAYKKGLHQNPAFMALSLKSLVRREAGFIKMAVRLDITPWPPVPSLWHRLAVSVRP